MTMSNTQWMEVMPHLSDNIFENHIAPSRLKHRIHTRLHLSSSRASSPQRMVAAGRTSDS